MKTIDVIVSTMHMIASATAIAAGLLNLRLVQRLRNGEASSVSTEESGTPGDSAGS